MTYRRFSEERLGAGEQAAAKPANYQIGDHVGFVDMVERRGPIEVQMPERWYVLQTFPNQEAKVMRRFRERNISAYHPLVRKLQILRGRKIDRSVPLFATLIFIPDYQASTGGVFVEGVDRFLRIGEYYPYLPEVAAPVRRAEVPIESRYIKRDEKLILDMVGIRRLEAEGNIPVARRRRLYKTGQLMRVIDGPFAGFKGSFERLDSIGRLTLLLDIFSRMTLVELDEGQIEAA
jgi:transcription termination/antitermination protein NusG